MGRSIGLVIHYCTNEYRYLQKVVDEAKRISDHIVIPVCDHFFNGAPENRALLEESYRQCPDCQFIEFAFHLDQLYSPFLSGYSQKDREWRPFWHSTSRYIGTLYLSPEIETILFLDADEIPEGERFAEWFDRYGMRDYSAIRLYSFLYLQRPTFRARAFYNSGLLVRRNAFCPTQILNSSERSGLFSLMPDPKIGGLLDGQEMPFVHHYSWVRTKEEAYCKARSWGHSEDRNWDKEIELLFKDPSSANVLTEKVSYEEIDRPYFNQFSVPIPEVTATGGRFPNVIKVDFNTIRRKEIDCLL